MFPWVAEGLPAGGRRTCGSRRRRCCSGSASACGSRCCSRCGRWSRCDACRRCRRCVASPDAEALRRARWDPLRITLSLAIVVSVLELGLSRANTVQRGIGFTAAIGGAIGILYLSASLLSWVARRVAAAVVAVSASPGNREPLSPGQPDARRGARARLRCVPHGHAVPGAAQHPAHRWASRLGAVARERRVLRRAGEPARRRSTRSFAPASIELIDQTPIVPMRIASINGKPVERHPRRGRTNTPRSSATSERATRRRGATEPAASGADRGRCGASFARPIATR